MTREEAIKQLSDAEHCLAGHGDLWDEDMEAFDMAIKALKQNSILDKIRAKIEALPKTYPFINHFDTYVKEDDVKRIIDKYKAEMESEE